MSNRLIIGPGFTVREGWKTLDAKRDHSPDYLGTIPPLPETVAAIFWDEIEWIHGISSLYPWQAAEALRELHGVLREGGKLVLEQPNIDIAVKAVMGGAPLFWLFGDPQHLDPLFMNHWGYTPESLEALLRKCGFATVSTLPAQYHLPSRDFRMEAIA